MRILELRQRIEKIKPFALSLLKDKGRFRILYFSLLTVSVLTLLLGFQWSVYVVWGLLGFGWSIFFFRKSINILEHFLLGGIVFTVLFLVFLCIFAIVNIPLNIFFFLAFLVISIIIFFKADIFQYVNLKLSDYDYLALLLFFFALVGKVFPLRNYYAASLHDPISHSMMARNIVNTGLIEYFYSPGLHIMAAFGELMKGFNVAKQVMLITAFYSAFSGTTIYVFLKRFFKNKVWALFVAILFSVGYYPSMLTYGAGKNTLIMALPVLFFSMFAIVQYVRKKDWKVLLTVIFSLATLFLVHYPTAVLGCLFLGVVVIVYFKDFKWKGFFAILGILFGLGWAVRSYRYQILLVDSLLDPERISVSYENNVSTVWDSMRYYLKSLWAQINVSLKDWNRYPTFLSSLALVVIAIEGIVKKNKKGLVLFLWVTCTFLFFVLLSALHIPELTILFESHLLTLTIFIYILCGYMVSKIFKFSTDYFLDKKKWGYILIGMFLTTITILSYMSYRKFKEFMINANYVYEEDIKVFDWIDENMEEDDGVLINAHDLYQIVFSSDAGGYIEIFTGNPISMPFYEYDRKDTYENYQLYLDLKSNPENCEYREALIESGYEYYYQGSRPFPDHIEMLFDEDVALEDIEGFKLLMKEGDAMLFEMEGCE